ncbi:MAG: signal peptide peptidase SppA [Mariprofundales bacterium]
MAITPRSLLATLWKSLTWLRSVSSNLIFLTLLVAIIATIVIAIPSLPEQAVLTLKLRGSLSEAPQPTAIPGLPFTLPSSRNSTLPQISQALAQAAKDDHIRALWLDLRQLAPAPLGRLQVVIDAIADFRRSGKAVAVYGDNFDRSQYLIASAADTIILHPAGGATITGPAYYRHYLKSALDRLQVRVQLFRAGHFKSFAEPLVRDTMSAAARSASSQWLNQWWQQEKALVAAARGVKPERLQQLLDDPYSALVNHHGDVAALLKHEHLVDQLADRHQAVAALNQRLKRTGENALPRIDYRDYLLIRSLESATATHSARIGILRASGEIRDGNEGGGILGDATARLIDDATDDAALKALVLRIDSPGGSALASETIHRALKRFRASGKPLVVSMGAIAASGGYWIATAADEIWARPETLTGSIGVFALIPDLHQGMHSLGIHLDGITTTKLTPIRPDRPLDAMQQSLLQLGIDHIYDQFLTRVMDGRHLSHPQAEALAEGRVWSGRDAKANGLVDHLGGLAQAVSAAATRAGLKKNEFQTVEIKGEQTPWKMVRDRLLGESLTWLPNRVQLWLQQAMTLTHLNDPRAIYAYAPL